MKLSEHCRALMNGAHALKFEIVCLIAFKVILITIIWFCFFSHPLTHHLSADIIQNHLLGSVAH